jgi:hypothetical protein
VRIGLLVTGDTSVRAGHSLAAHPGIDELVVIGPATSKNFKVAQTAEGCEFLVGSGDKAPRLARKHGVPLVWDGDDSASGVAVWGASPLGLALALAARETDPRLVAVAHQIPGGEGADRRARFPDPVGRVGVHDEKVGGKPIAVGRSNNDSSACLVEGASRRVTIVDDGAFLAGIALAAGVAVAVEGGGAVWDSALTYLETATEMGLVMAES